MALTSCKECGAQVASTAYECPQCGAPLRKLRRGPIGVLIKWLFILFNIGMIVWLVTYIGNVAEMSDQATSEAQRAGTAIGGTLGVGMLIGVWVAGDIILGLLTLFTRPRRK